MKKMPLILILFLILIVLIIGIVDSSRHHDDRDEPHDILSKYSSYVSRDSSEGDPSMSSEKPDSIRDEKTFIVDNIQKSDEMALNLEETVKRLQEEGNDVGKLDEMVKEYALHVSEARDYISMADNSSSTSDEQEYMSLSKEKIILANSELKGIFIEIKTYMPGPLTLSGNESLEASGAGIVILSGDLDLDMSISEGKFSVVDFAGDAQINTDELYGSAIKSEQVVIPENDTMHQMISYNDVHGNVSISGSILTVAVMGTDVTLDLSGTGDVELYGDGTYTFSNSTMEYEGIWIPPVFDTK
jgi:hypothetical protein